MPNYLIQKDPQNLIPFTGTSTQADVYARDFTVYTANSDGSKTLYSAPTSAYRVDSRPKAVALTDRSDTTPTVVDVATYAKDANGNITGLVSGDWNVLNLRKKQSVVGPLSDGQCSNLTSGTDFSCTSRLLFTAKEALQSLQLQYDAGPSSATASGGEIQMLNGCIYQASVEYPLGTTPVLFSVNGSRTFVVNPDTSGVLTDVLGIQIPAAGQFAIRTFARVPTFPASPAAAATAGGSLTNATAYWYAITTVDNGLESGPSAEFTFTTSSPNLAGNLSWTPPAFGDTINIYRSAASAGTKQLIGSVSAKSNGFIDWGVTTPNTAVNPPAAALVVRGLSRHLLTGESTNRVLYGGAGTNQVAVSGALTGQVNFGPAGPGPNVVIGGGAVVSTFGSEGDSIQFGTGIQSNNGVAPGTLSPWQSNWFAAGCLARSVNFYQHSIGGAQANWFLDGTHIVRARQGKQRFCDYLVSNLGSNDLAAGGRTWQQLAADVMVRAQSAYSQGATYIPTTILPRTTSTDNWITATNQTPVASNAARINYNNWLRNGFLVDGAGAPVLTGGTKFAYLWKFIELADVLEVNSSNVLTRDGGYCLAPSAARYTGLILNGSPSTTALAFTTSPFAAATNSERGVSMHSVKMTSGARVGNVAIVSYTTYNLAGSLTLYADGSTVPTGIALRGLTGAPAAADTVDVYEVYFADGIHPTLAGHNLLSPVFQTFLATLGA